MSANENNLIWIDLEMTGLDPERDRIIEIATLVTDANLNILAEGPTIAVHQSDEQLALMDDWNVRTHTASGLVERVKASTMGDREAELATLEFLKQWVPAGKSPICGNSIGQDRRFLFKYMPELEAYFHYRYLDVSTLKELARRWKPEILDGFTKQGTHQAMDDIRESVASWLTTASILSSCKIFPGHVSAGIHLRRRDFDAKLNVLLIISALEIKTQKTFLGGCRGKDFSYNAPPVTTQKCENYESKIK